MTSLRGLERLASLLSLILAGCTCATPPVPPAAPLHTTHASPPPSTTPPPPVDPTPEARQQLARARDDAQARADATPPGATTGARIAQHARQLAGAQLLPDLIEAAQRRVYVSTRAASLHTAWPALAPTTAPTAAATPKARRRGKAPARRPKHRTVQPGELRLLYGKGAGALRIQLFDTDGRMRPEAYVQLCRALYEPQREPPHVEQPWIAYDPRLFTLLYLVSQHFDAPVEIISAYRSPGRRSRSRSNHNLGQAADITLKDVNRHALLAFVESTFDQIGAGWYPRSTFIHLDTRDRSYYWTDSSKPGRSARHHERPRVRKPKPGRDGTVQTIHIDPWNP